RRRSRPDGGALHEVVLRAAARRRGARGTPPRAQGRADAADGAGLPCAPDGPAPRRRRGRGRGAARDRDTLTPRAGRGRALGGANVFTWFLDTEGAPFRRELSVVQVDDDPWEIGRSYPVSLGIVADPRETLVELTRALATTLTDAARTAARARAETIGRGRA